MFGLFGMLELRNGMLGVERKKTSVSLLSYIRYDPYLNVEMIGI